MTRKAFRLAWYMQRDASKRSTPTSSERRSCPVDASSMTTGMSANARERVIGRESNLKDKLAKKNGFAPNGRAASAAILGPLISNLRATIAESHQSQRIAAIWE